jgi:hypothetical protein
MAERAERVIHSPKGLVIFAHPDGADYARMMQLRKSRWMGTQIIRLWLPMMRRQEQLSRPSDPWSLGNP